MNAFSAKTLIISFGCERGRPVSTMCRLRCMDEEQVTCGRKDDLSFGLWLP
jgi:hypothetical protein